MNIIVCVKQVPDMGEMSFDYERKVLIRDGVPNILNPFDKRAISKAVNLKAMFGGEVTAFTMGPPQARAVLYECLAVGADKAIHLSDPAFSGADTLATARALAAAIKRQPFDLIMCGKYSVDAETGQVGPQVAEILDIPHITGVSSLTFDDTHGYVIAERETDAGFETIRCTLPALITAAERLIKPIKIKEPDLEAVKHKPIEVVTAKELSDDLTKFGQAGSPTWVSEILSVPHKREVEFIEGTTHQIAQNCAQRLCDRGLFCGWETPDSVPRAPEDQPRDVVAGKSILVVAELSQNKLRAVSYELLNRAKELADTLGGCVVALLIGPNASEHTRELSAYGADKIYLVEGEQFASFNPYDYTSALITVITKIQPFAVLIPSTANGRDFAPRVAARLGLGLTADCVGLQLNDRRELVQLKPAYGGQIVASILSKTRPQMATVRPGMLEKGSPNYDRECDVEHWIMPATIDRYQVLASTDGVGEAAIELDDAEVVVCVGMGIGGPENLPMIESFAKTLGAAIGATRRVVDRGWVPRQQQIGITGRAISPKLYIGVGVRGVFNHTIGIRRSGIVVAINSDPQASIFEVADYGIVADVCSVIPILTDELARKKLELLISDSTPH
ncbi:MAG TPA: FAD-binding protein [Pyrinomonadaceae bacterium]|nr:FAD-binding protein [Pyrinomonadaceae bacterium]